MGRDARDRRVGRLARPAAKQRASTGLQRWWLLAALVIVLAAAAVAVLVTRPVGNQAPTSSGPIAGLEVYDNLSRDHDEGTIAYPQTPPVGGPHNPQWQNCGIYDQPVPNETAVHSLEHGAVWITYRSELPTDQVEKLRSLVRGKSHALLSPYPGQPAPVIATAWGLQLKLDSADDPRLEQFGRTYHNGPQTPEPGASCTGGVGQPIAR